MAAQDSCTDKETVIRFVEALEEFFFVGIGHLRDLGDYLMLCLALLGELFFDPRHYLVHVLKRREEYHMVALYILETFKYLLSEFVLGH